MGLVKPAREAWLSQRLNALVYMEYNVPSMRNKLSSSSWRRAAAALKKRNSVSIFSQKSFFCCCSLSWVSELIGKAAATGAASRDAALVAVLDEGLTS